MINENGQFEVLTLNDALALAIELAADAGITITSGSVEQQIANYLAQLILEFDNDLYQSYQKQFDPTGSDIDLQNPNVPRLTAQPASGYLLLTNATGSPITVPIQTIFIAANSNQYSTNNNTVIVASMSTAIIAVQSVERGAAQNMPSNQSFTASGLDLTATNPQPYVNGRDIETDTQYLVRLILRKTNLSSIHATATAELELEEFYTDALIYVNNDSTTLTDPVPIPSNGYTPVILVPSGPESTIDEIRNALDILSKRLQFGNPLKIATAIHPILSGTIYVGSFPQVYYFVPAQVVETTITCTISVAFPSNVDESEKEIQAVAFAKLFAQNINNYFGGADGSVNVEFNPLVGDPVVTTESILAANGLIPKIAPVFSIEQIRAFISEAVNLNQTELIIYLACDDLVVELDPLVAYEASITMDINDPYTPQAIDFKTTALFSDDTSWFDRYIFIDPALITITIDEAEI
jgi:hypothetical protein